MNSRSTAARNKPGNLGQNPATKNLPPDSPKDNGNGQISSSSAGRKKASQSVETEASPNLPSAPISEMLRTERNEVPFRLDAPSAREVLLAGEFTQWDKAPIKMIKGGGGTWHAKVPLEPGHYSYRFLVDGEWQDDPNCQRREPNPFGTYNSIAEIP